MHAPRAITRIPSTEPLERRQLLSGVAASLFPDEVFSAGAWADYGASPFVLTGDYNRDGAADVITPLDEHNLAWLPGDGHGRLGAAVAIPAGDRAIDAAQADLNSDGIADLVTLDRVEWGTTGSVSVLLGRGDGSFRRLPDVAVGTTPSSIAVADFNGDGRPDLAVTHQEQYEVGGVAILLGKGNGTFARAKFFGTAAAAGKLTVSDFNADGHVDLAVEVLDGYNVLSVFLGRGDGTFRNAKTVDSAGELGGTPRALVAGDFTGDGRKDLIASYTYYVGDPDSNEEELVGTVNLLVGRGDGTFVVHNSTLYEGLVGALTAGDFNRDGKLDLGSADGVFLGNGRGKFTTVAAVESFRARNTVATADFNRDGILDFVTVAGPDLSVLIRLGRADGNVASPPTLDAGAGRYSTDAISGDFNGDRILDIATISSSLGSEATVVMALGRGDGTFRRSGEASVGIGGHSLAIGDFNRDGRLDLATANFETFRWYDSDTTVSVLLGRGDGTFSPARTMPVGVVPEDVFIADVTGDGVVDLLTQDYGQIAILRGRGNGTFDSAVTVNLDAYVVAVEDLNGDGKADLAGTDNSNNRLAVFTNRGSNRFTKASLGGLPQLALRNLADVDGDGRKDMLAIAMSDYSTYAVLSAGGGSFRSPRRISEGVVTAVADVTGDGLVDLVEDGIRVRAGLGNMQFADAGAYSLGSGLTTLIGDFNRDGNLDVAGVDYDGVITTLLNRRSPGTGGIAGQVFNDRNANGRKDTGDAGIANQLVWVDLNRDGKLNHNEPRIMTDAKGRYAFSRVQVGQQLIRLERRPGWLQTSPRGGGAHTPLILSDRILRDWDFGIQRIA